MDRPLIDQPIGELRLELALRVGPRFQCQAKDCRAFHMAPTSTNKCPSCGRVGYLCGSFKRDEDSPEWKQWQLLMEANYRIDPAE